MVREYSNKLIELVEAGILNGMDVLRNVICNYMSEEDVQDFCESEYEELFDILDKGE